MNCPKCGASPFQHGVKSTSGFYDAGNKMYYRRFRCKKCNRVFYTVEFEIECDGELLEAFACKAPLSEEKVAASKKRFDDYRAFHNKNKQGNRRSDK